MKRFVVKLLKFLALPAAIILFAVITYLRADPYFDFGKRPNYSWTYFFQQLGDLATKKLLASKTNYNSFVFGSSRSVSLYACYLDSVIPGSNFFHYGNWTETIGGIYNKLRLVDSLGYPVDHAVIYFDTDFTFSGDGSANSSDHYLISGQTKKDYRLMHFNAIFKNLTLEKIRILFGRPVSGLIYPHWDSDPVTNDAKHHCSDPSILAQYAAVKKDDAFRHEVDSLRKAGIIYKRPLHQQFKKQGQISDKELKILTDLKAFFDKHHTNYYIVITPIFDQLKFNPNDQAKLKSLFGNRLYDFSGINAFTNDEYNYTDGIHFQPYISKLMIDSILRKEIEPAADQSSLLP